MWRQSGGVYFSPLLSNLPWLRHGFAGRNAPDWPGRYASLGQIHSNIVVSATDEDELRSRQGDAILTDKNGLWIGVRTADCVPLLIADRKQRVVAAVHAGWRGTVAEIAIRAVEQMKSIYGSCPEHLVAAVGPSIAQCCYETGREVSDLFQKWFPEAGLLTFVNLPETNRRQLLTCGLPPNQIDVSGLCTTCSIEKFHSWRRDRDRSGRMVAAICVSEK